MWNIYQWFNIILCSVIIFITNTFPAHDKLNNIRIYTKAFNFKLPSSYASNGTLFSIFNSVHELYGTRHTLLFIPPELTYCSVVLGQYHCMPSCGARCWLYCLHVISDKLYFLCFYVFGNIWNNNINQINQKIDKLCNAWPWNVRYNNTIK